MVQFQLEVFGQVQLARRLSRFGEGVEDFRPAFRNIVEMLRGYSVKQFSSRGQGQWPPLSPAYAKWKAKHYPGQPLMVLTGALRQSLISNTSQTIEKVEPKFLQWGTRVDYARYHQLGRGVPVRRVIDLTEANKTAIMKELQKYVVALARGTNYE